MLHSVSGDGEIDDRFESDTNGINNGLRGTGVILVASPSEVPSFAPTLHPSTDPSMEPTAEPTKMPSASPSELPSPMPSTDPSVNPTLTPSTEPSLMPTLVPSAVPSFVPSMAPSAIPTIRPTNPADVDFELTVTVEQEVFNCNKDDYDAQQLACNFTIQHTVADAVIGVAPERVTDIVVEEEEEETGRRSFRTGVSVNAATDRLVGWHIALIVIGGVLALVLIVSGVWWRRSKKSEASVLPGA
eukprot:gene9105-10750_t